MSSAVVRDLGVLLDSELSMKHHISKVTSTCYYHLRRLHQIRNYLSRKTLIQIVMSFVISRIDYCNSVLVGLPVSTLAPLQQVQNAAVWLILGLNRRSHITPALKQLHWLPSRLSPFEQERSLVVAPFQSADQTFGTACLST